MSLKFPDELCHNSILHSFARLHDFCFEMKCNFTHYYVVI